MWSPLSLIKHINIHVQLKNQKSVQRVIIKTSGTSFYFVSTGLNTIKTHQQFTAQ